MRYRIVLILILSSLTLISKSQLTNWKGMIHRPDGKIIVFNFSVMHGKKPYMTFTNANEKILVTNMYFTQDSVFFKMPVFESSFKAKISNSFWDGVWIKGTANSDQVLPFTAMKNAMRFEAKEGKANYNISGRWQVSFANDKTQNDASIAEFKQTGNKIYGTFLTPSGDYRYQEGIVSGNKLRMSGFDGGHAFLFTADINSKNQISNGMFYSGAKYSEGFKAIKNANATVSTDNVSMFLKAGEKKLDFKFPDLNGRPVSINDSEFKNKVVIIQILGSWCPNCMDETAFLSQYYRNNKQKGIAIIGLAYEYSTNFQRSVLSLSKFKDKFNITYPLLITGVTVNDSLRTEKTLPQVTPIKVFPSTIFIDKKGNVRKFDTGFFGPSTGQHYEEFKKEFNETVQSLLNE